MMPLIINKDSFQLGDRLITEKYNISFYANTYCNKIIITIYNKIFRLPNFAGNIEFNNKKYRLDRFTDVIVGKTLVYNYDSR